MNDKKFATILIVVVLAIIAAGASITYVINNSNNERMQRNLQHIIEIEFRLDRLEGKELVNTEAD